MPPLFLKVDTFLWDLGAGNNSMTTVFLYPHLHIIFSFKDLHICFRLDSYSFLCLPNLIPINIRGVKSLHMLKAVIFHFGFSNNSLTCTLKKLWNLGHFSKSMSAFWIILQGSVVLQYPMFFNDFLKYLRGNEMAFSCLSIQSSSSLSYCPYRGTRLWQCCIVYGIRKANVKADSFLIPLATSICIILWGCILFQCSLHLNAVW